MAIKIIVALDYHDKSEALKLVDVIDPKVCALKVGSELFTRLGPSFVKALVQKGFSVFLDLKFHDIPTTVAKACCVAADMGVWMLNVHASGGIRMMTAANEALLTYGQNKPLLIAVTVLTSMGESDLAKAGVTQSMEEKVNELAYTAFEAGLNGVVCSAQEVKSIKERCGNEFIAVTPGIRLINDAENLSQGLHHFKDDQVRIVTPRDAIRMQSDYLVIGRPITQALNPSLVIAKILQDVI